MKISTENFLNHISENSGIKFRSFEEFVGMSAEKFVQDAPKIVETGLHAFEDKVLPSIPVASDEVVKLYKDFQAENDEIFKKAIPKNCIKIVEKLLALPSYGNSILPFVAKKKKSELEHLYELAIKEDSAGEMRIPGVSFHYFSIIPEERLKMLEPIILSVNESGRWNYSPSFMWYLDKQYSDKQLELMSKMAQLKINGWNLRELVRNPHLRHSKIIEKAETLNRMYKEKLRDIQFLSDDKQNYISIEVKGTEDGKDFVKTFHSVVDIDEAPVSSNYKIEEKCASEIKSNIYKSLKVFTPQELEIAIQKVKNGLPEAKESEILRVMQTLTQFASYSSLEKIEEKLEKENIVKIFSQGGLNDIFSYFSRIKNILNLNYYIKDKCEGILITKEDLEDKNFIEKVKDRVQISNEKFIILEGWSDGINLFNDNNLLAQKTIEVIKKAKQKELQEQDFTFNDALKYVLNNELETYLRKIGAKYNIITIDAPATRQSILDQMKPIMPTETMLESTIKSLINYFSKNKENADEVGKKIVEYYWDNLNIYSKQRMIDELKIMKEKIEEYMSNNNIAKEDLYLLTPREIKSPAKSYDIVNKMFADIMQIPVEKQIKTYSVEDLSKYPEKAVFIIADDIVASGESMSQAAKYNKYGHTLGDRRILFCPITGAKEGIKYLEDTIAILKRGERDAIICNKDNIMSYEYTAESFIGDKDKLYSKVFGQRGCADLGMCTVFPYMAPDNNSDLAAYFIKHFTPNSYCIKNKNEAFPKVSEDAMYFDIYGTDQKHAETNGKKVKFLDKLLKFFK